MLYIPLDGFAFLVGCSCLIVCFENENTGTLAKHVLFVQGGGEGAYQADATLVTNLGSQLGLDYEVRYPKMPDEASPNYSAWRQHLSEEIAALGSGAVLVGHSLGASILLKALAEGENQPAFTGVFLVATPFWGGEGWGEWEEVELPEDERARLAEIDPIFFYHGRDDEVIPHAHLDLYAKALPHAKMRRLAGRNHQLNENLSEVAADIRRLG